MIADAQPAPASGRGNLGGVGAPLEASFRRSLCLGGITPSSVAPAVAWVVGILLVTVPLATLRYRRTTA